MSSGDYFHLTAEILTKLRAALDDHCKEAEAQGVLLIATSGIRLAEGGPAPPEDEGEIAALVAGAYAAVGQLAYRLGENHFDGLLHQGRDQHFYLNPTGDDHLLLTTFKPPTTAGVVRACAVRTVEKIRGTLSVT